MTKYFTGKGDKGKTSFNGEKVSKSSLFIEVLGSLDELNSWLGVAKTEVNNEFILDSIKEIQEFLFIAQAEIAVSGTENKLSTTISVEETKKLELIIKKINEEVPEITNFIIPGGSQESTVLDFGRALARRTERKIVQFSKEQNISDEILQFINRLSSVLFALARYSNYQKDIKEKHPKYK